MATLTVEELNKGYRISLGTKREEDRWLGCNNPLLQLQWLIMGTSGILDLTKEEAMGYIENILAAKMPTEPHDIDSWTLLKLQACCQIVREHPEEFEWRFTEYLNPVYIGLFRIDTGYNEKEWHLELDEV